MGQAGAVEWGSFSRRGETEDAKSPRDDGGARLEGPVRYDGARGVWVPIERESGKRGRESAARGREPVARPEPKQEPSLDPDPVAMLAVIAANQSHQKATRESGSIFKLGSWFRGEPETGRRLVTPPVDTSEPEFQPVTLRPETPIAPSSTAVEDLAAPELQTVAIDEHASLPASSSATGDCSGGNMWQSVTDQDESISTAAPSAGETPQAVHDQDAVRWFVLKSVLAGAPAPLEAPIAPATEVPVLEVFSLAGGVGKTSLVASLGRALSARGEHVLLVEATRFGSMPYFFGSCDCRPGALRTFKPPAASTDAPIRLATIDPDAVAAENAAQGSLAAEIEGWARGTSRVVVDVSTRSTATVRALARMSPTVLIPLLPDLNSVLAAKSVDSLFQRHTSGQGAPPDIYYVLNQFDSSLPLHVEVRKVLREKLGERLLPFELQRTPAVSEALLEGMTVMDYAPDSPIAKDLSNLAKWLESVAAPVDMHARSRRWSEQ